MNSRLYRGRVWHDRRAPIRNRFSYRVFQVYLDLDELDTVFTGRWLWSTRRPALAWFRRRDHLGPADEPLAASIRRLIAERAGITIDGPIGLLTHLRTWGYVMNPVSFYYAFARDGVTLRAIVADVHNTPWGERHAYVLPVESSLEPNALHFRFPKTFHVSPFMDMEQTYDWRFSVPGERLTVHMENEEDGERPFAAHMDLEVLPITSWNLARVLVRHPFMTGKVIAAIYWQALRLWWKRCPFHPHPARVSRGA